MKTKTKSVPIPEKIKLYRNVNSLTQGQLGKKLGIKASYVSHFESGRRVIPGNILIKLVRVTDEYISLDDVFSYTVS